MIKKEELGKYIKTLREENRMSQAELARILAVEPQTVSKWETGSGYPDIGLVESLAGYFGIGMTDFLAGNLVPERKTKAAGMNGFEERQADVTEYLSSRDFATMKRIFEKYSGKIFPADRTPEERSLSEKWSANGIPALLGILWDYDESGFLFKDHRSQVPFEQVDFRMHLLSHRHGMFADERWIRYVIRHFDEPFPESFLSRQDSLRFGMAYLAPIADLRGSDELLQKYPFLNELDYRFHPQISFIREFIEHPVDFDGSEKAKNLFLKSNPYTKEHVFRIFEGKRPNMDRIYFSTPKNAGSGALESASPTFSPKALDVLDHVCPKDLVPVLESLYRKFGFSVLRERILAHLDQSIEKNDGEEIAASVQTIRSLWPKEEKELLGRLAEIRDPKTLRFLAEKCLVFPQGIPDIDERDLKASMNQMLRKIQILEDKVVSLETRLERVEKHI